MKKITRTLIALMVATLGLVATGCSSNAGGGSKASYIANEEEVAAAVEILGDDLSVMKVSVDGVIYSYPMNVQFLLDQGWAFPEEALKELDPFPANTEYRNCEMTRTIDEQEQTMDGLMLLNESLEDIPVGEAMITLYSLDRYQKLKMILPGGITWASTIDDVKAAYGEPASEGSSGSEDTFINTTLTYNFDPGIVRIGFQTKDGETKLNSVAFYCD